MPGLILTSHMLSAALTLFGALLRLKKWHKANIEMIAPDECFDTWEETLNKWEESLGVTRVWPASRWSPLPGVLWRGDIIAEKEVSLS